MLQMTHRSRLNPKLTVLHNYLVYVKSLNGFIATYINNNDFIHRKISYVETKIQKC